MMKKLGMAVLSLFSVLMVSCSMLHNNADDIIDDSGAHDCCADLIGQPAHILKGLGCDADRRSRQNRSDKNSLKELLTADLPESVEGTVEQSSADQRYKYTAAGNDRRF